MALTKKLLNSEAERLEMTLQLAKQKLVNNGAPLVDQQQRVQTIKSNRSDNSLTNQNAILIQTLSNNI